MNYDRVSPFGVGWECVGESGFPTFAPSIEDGCLVLLLGPELKRLFKVDVGKGRRKKREGAQQDPCFPSFLPSLPAQG